MMEKRAREKERAAEEERLAWERDVRAYQVEMQEQEGPIIRKDWSSVPPPANELEVAIDTIADETHNLVKSTKHELQR